MPCNSSPRYALCKRDKCQPYASAVTKNILPDSPTIIYILCALGLLPEMSPCLLLSLKPVTHHQLTRVALQLRYRRMFSKVWLICAQAPRLKSLNLAFCSSLLDSGMRALACISTLTDLNLAYCKWISNDGISELSVLTALTSLNLQGCSQTVPHLSQGLTALHCMPKLASLNLGSCKLRPHALLALAQLTRLTELSLRFCKGVVPSDLSSVSCLERLKSLDINGCLACTDASLGCLHPLKGLRQLNIGFNKQLTDAALKQLLGLTHLQHLLLNNCPLLTEAALDLLLTALPSLMKMTTTESHDAEQLLMLHTKRVATYGNIQLTHLEQDQVIEHQ